ncbi:MAG: Pr6Pr family membrane protein, partial [Streptococcus minor]|nr:Pr6Pr family membrane protein [Streptococcus minor]
MYYTVQSNLLVSIFAIYMVVAMQQNKNLQSTKFLRIKAAITMSIMITFVIYHFMLAPLATDFWRVENILCHYITPLYFFFDTLLVDRQRQYSKVDPVYWTALPVFYMLFALFNGLVLKWPIPDAKDSPFAYYFINVTKYGWGYVAIHAVVIFIVYILSGYLLYALKSMNWKSSNRLLVSKTER